MTAGELRNQLEGVGADVPLIVLFGALKYDVGDVLFDLPDGVTYVDYADQGEHGERLAGRVRRVALLVAGRSDDGHGAGC